MDLFGDLKEKIEDIRTNLKPLLDKFFSFFFFFFNYSIEEEREKNHLKI